MFPALRHLPGKLVTLGIFWLSLYACENDMKDIKAITDRKMSVEEGTNIESYYSQDAKMKAKLTAPLLKRYITDSPYYEFPKSLHVDFFNDSLEVESRVDALYGRYKDNEKKVFLKDSVVVSNNKGDTLHCLELWWNQAAQKFYTDKPVRMIRADKTIIYGRSGLEATQNLDNVVFFKSSGFATIPRDMMLQDSIQRDSLRTDSLRTDRLQRDSAQQR